MSDKQLNLVGDYDLDMCVMNEHIKTLEKDLKAYDFRVKIQQQVIDNLLEKIKLQNQMHALQTLRNSK